MMSQNDNLKFTISYKGLHNQLETIRFNSLAHALVTFKGLAPKVGIAHLDVKATNSQGDSITACLMKRNKKGETYQIHSSYLKRLETFERMAKK